MIGMLNEQVFRAYDIRGIYPRDIDEEFAEGIGHAFGRFIGKGKRVLVGRDVRISSPSLSERLVRGILDEGLGIVYAGIIPTPLLYFAISRYGLDGGITVSASHNPPEWNGFKVCRDNAYVIGLGSGLETMREMMNKGGFGKADVSGKMVDNSASIMKDYLDFISGMVGPLNGLKVGVDPGNGAYSGTGSSTFARKGADVHPLNDVPDGTFPSRSPEPTPSSIAGLVRLVKSEGLDLGVAFDGDGDRVLFVTEKGDVIEGDVALALLVRAYLKPGQKVVYEPSCSTVVEDEIREMKGVPLLTKVGHSHFKSAMKTQGAAMGGEISGHMYFSETYGAEDGLFAGLKVADMLIRSGRKFSQLVDELPKYSKVFVEVDADDKIKYAAVERAKEKLSKEGYRIVDVDGVKAYTDDGWLLIRPSNTTPKIKMTAEAKDRKRAEQLIQIAKEGIGRAIQD